jgi:hypothetical protein
MALEIEEVLSYLNNYFVYAYAPHVYIDITASTKTIALADITYDFDDYALDIKVGQYVRIEGTRLNDGVYKVVTVATTSFTVLETLIDEVSDEDLDYITISELAIPNKLLSIITEMIAWTGTDNVKSESLGPHSITYDRPSNVFTSFEGRIKRWKKLGWK